MKLLTRQEEIVLLTIWRLKEEAYGVSILESISAMTGKKWSIGSLYVPLDRLMDKGCIQYFYKDEVNSKGGRRRRFYRITRDGMASLQEVLRFQKSLWDGFPGFAMKP